MKNKLFHSIAIGCSVTLLVTATDTRPCGSGGSVINTLPSLGGSGVQANALNAAGQITGVSFTSGDAQMHAFLFTGGSMADLGALGGGFAQGLVINSSGQVAGEGLTAAFEFHAMLHDGTTLIDLDTLGGNSSIATGINDSGKVVGNSLIADGITQQGFIYANGAMTSLGHLGGGSSSAAAINNLGNVTGDSFNEFGDMQAFFWTNGVMTGLGTLGGFFSSATAMNDSDVIVGDSDTLAGEIHAFVYAAGEMTDLGTLVGGDFSSARGINASGQIFGQSRIGGGDEHGFFHSAGTMTDIGTLGGASSTALAMNNLGQIVGASATSSGNNHAFLWQNGTMIDLNSVLPAGSGWVLLDAQFINDAGRVVGFGTLNNGSATYILDLGSGNNPPVAHAGADQVVDCQGQATLDGSQSSDPDNDALTFEWREGTIVLGTTPVLSVSLPFGTHTITLTVTDPCGASASDDVLVDVVDTTAPVIHSGPSISPIAANAQCQAAVPSVIADISATDNCTPAGSLIISQSPEAGTLVALGSHIIIVTVTDAANNSSSGSVSFTVVDASAPTIVSSPGSVTTSANAQCQGTIPNVVADVVATDNCSGALTITQSPDAGTLLGVGTHTITVTVTDASGNGASVPVTLIVKDTTAPVINSLSVTPSVLSPPNKRTVPVTVSVSSSDACDPAPVCKIVSITVNEAADAGDAEVTGDLTANLAATRNPSGTGRVYSITVECKDAAGNSTTGTVTVSVPKGGGGGGGGRP